jgi:hypothetical protein
MARSRAGSSRQQKKTDTSTGTFSGCRCVGLFSPYAWSNTLGRLRWVRLWGEPALLPVQCCHAHSFASLRTAERVWLSAHACAKPVTFTCGLAVGRRR